MGPRQYIHNCIYHTSATKCCLTTPVSAHAHNCWRIAHLFSETLAVGSTGNILKTDRGTVRDALSLLTSAEYIKILHLIYCTIAAVSV